MKGCCFLLLPALAMLVLGCAEGGVPEFDGESAYRYLLEQCEIGPRYPGSRGHAVLQRYLVDKLKSYGANVSLQQFEAVLSTGDTLRLVNILGNYNMRSRHRVLLGAHYDTRPWADKDGNPENRSKPILGANDGASGVAVLLEIARLLGGVPPPVGVDIVFFDGEDSGVEGESIDWILGSTHFAKHLKGYRPRSVIVVDMIGERDVRIGMEGLSRAASAELLEEVFSIAERLGVDAFKRENAHTVIDDHLPFIQAGIPSIDLIDFDYPYWHTLEDTPDKCSPESLEAVGRVLLEFLWAQD
jgi:hypothetical protein